MFVVSLVTRDVVAGSITYNFVEIARASASDQFRSFGAPSLNNNGQVTFEGVLNEVDNFKFVNGIYSGSGGPTSAIAERRTGGQFQRILGKPSINDSGDILFFGETTVSGIRRVGLFLDNGTSTSPIVQAGDAIGSGTALAGSLLTNSAVNNNGTVATLANTTNTIGVYTGSGPLGTEIQTGIPSFNTRQAVSINNNGRVAFHSTFLTEISSGSGGATTTIASTSGSSLDRLSPADINDNGTVAFFATDATNGEAILTGNGGALTTVARQGINGFTGFIETTSDVEFTFPGINNNGDVAFVGIFNDPSQVNPREGLFTGGDPFNDDVILIDDPLFESTVTELVLYRGINDNGQLAFQVSLENGSSVIVRADPVNTVPEPSSILMFLTGILSLFTFTHIRSGTRIGGR